MLKFTQLLCRIYINNQTYIRFVQF